LDTQREFREDYYTCITVLSMQGSTIGREERHVLNEYTIRLVGVIGPVP
jgi:hypothetical protein